MPFVQKSDTLHEILLKVSEGRLGLACVGDAANVEGVITDGDLRRAIASSDKPNSLTAAQIATTKPCLFYRQCRFSRNASKKGFPRKGKLFRF